MKLINQSRLWEELAVCQVVNYGLPDLLEFIFTPSQLELNCFQMQVLHNVFHKGRVGWSICLLPVFPVRHCPTMQCTKERKGSLLTAAAAKKKVMYKVKLNAQRTVH